MTTPSDAQELGESMRSTVARTEFPVPLKGRVLIGVAFAGMSFVGIAAERST
jgi:hypothetical protein